ncbi:DUF2062 domain-containing protein [Craterilacuibacter sp. RT1T]|uniref:DUF2062 domain-containing protein n=1 Tax=Craterilacuibacter sp. RT1T TaxID=2942211 RepID=UPI0020BEEBE5|nr:DUF2062 domain-containing protein [Craterilacuibacter sp. RT1T]MCL6262505.1 DUF2062 domain-containing protein [Craterilacuibacter sp. RT1T]
MPDRDAVFANRCLRPLAPWLDKPAYWSWNRRKVALAFAVGLFSGLMPGPTQMLAAALLALVLRVNLPVALATTLYTNPFTYLPLYWLAYAYGRFLLDVNGAASISIPPPELQGLDFASWLHAFILWCQSLGLPLLLGVPALGLTFAVSGYVLVRLIWRACLVFQFKKRRRKRGSH